MSFGLAGQWNPMEWDRAADELTWERLLGLDGSLVFLEHVFWVVSLNTLFIVVFGKSSGAPYLLLDLTFFTHLFYEWNGDGIVQHLQNSNKIKYSRH